GDVVRVVNPGLMPAGRVRPDPTVARQMVHEAVKRLCGESDLGAAFRRFVAPTEKVGIKPNCLAGRFSSTSRAVVDAIVDGVRAAGVPDDRILIFDQYPGNMAAAGFPTVTNPRLGQIRVYPHTVLGYEDREV